MKLKFKKDLDFQTAAIEAVCGLFDGARREPASIFSLEKYSLFKGLDDYDGDVGRGNSVKVDDEKICVNMRAVQLKNGLPQTETLSGVANAANDDALNDVAEIETAFETGATAFANRPTRQFTIEMETGTGKTYICERYSNCESVTACQSL